MHDKEERHTRPWKLKLLGVTFDANLTWTPNIDDFCKIVSSGLYAVKILKQVADIKTAKTAYLFGLLWTIIWGVTLLRNMERELIFLEQAIIVLADLQPLTKNPPHNNSMHSCNTRHTSFQHRLTRYGRKPLYMGCKLDNHLSDNELGIMTVVNLYIQELIIYPDTKNPPHNNSMHSCNTRHTSSQQRLTRYGRQPLYMGCKLDNHLPDNDLGIMTVVNLYIQELIIYPDTKNPPHNNSMHSCNTRHTSSQQRLTRYGRQPLYMGCKLDNHLPDNDLGIMTVVNLYIQELIIYPDTKNPPHNNSMHSCNTRHTSSQQRLTRYGRQPLYMGCKLDNHLPEKLIRMSEQDLKRASKWLTERPHYSQPEFYNDN
ncbi:hypothetical protein J6590_053428 [Homalodisca vitripennis]|nr:hypothetical protein J6590_053428 [Homalodisca vitripennis]